MKGGLAETTGLKEEDVDPQELSIGIQVEMEHTDDPSIAKEIALDHLAEDPKYYSKLGKCFPHEHEKKVKKGDKRDDESNKDESSGNRGESERGESSQQSGEEAKREDLVFGSKWADKISKGVISR
jgi:hypothetical protein